MRFRARHLACLLVLISALGVAGKAQAEPAVFRGRYIDVLLYRHAAEASSQAAHEETQRLPGEEPADTTALPVEAAAALHAVWPMPSARADAASRIARTSIARA